MYWVLICLLLCSNYHTTRANDVSFSSKFEHFDEKLDENSSNGITAEEWRRYTQLALDSVNKQNRLEDNLMAARVTVQNGSISHTTLLDSLPEGEAHSVSEFAKRMLKISQYAYNAKCAQYNNRANQCLRRILNQPLPADSQLLEQCINMTSEHSNGMVLSFRRLLPKNYKDGLYEMFNSERLPSPRLISGQALEKQLILHSAEFKTSENLVLVQWAQFIEHDLSKPVVTSMAKGESIECCNTNNYKLQPRFHHPACSPILGKGNHDHPDAKKTCMNYVRSALVMGPSCTLAALEQVNHATSLLDLSQLYGFTREDQQLMRLYADGQLNSSKSSTLLYRDFLPMPDTDDLHEYCALKQHETQDAGWSNCFIAGDSRVNSNPFAVVIYTLFMRNHNQIAQKLKMQHGNWNDEQLFGKAKAINIDIYRRIIFNEWLPNVLGDSVANHIESNTLDKFRQSNEVVSDQLRISHEFAVAAMRFYVSMMPNVLQKTTTPSGGKVKRSSVTDNKLFVIKDQIYNPTALNSSISLNVILESLLHQRAMQMDSAYVESFVLNTNSHPTHADLLAIDIQRGRDHGLQGYVMYLEVCQNIKINSWKDLEHFITAADLHDLSMLYKSVRDIDLIVGGIAEKPLNGSLVGPTFACIMAEQFEQIQRDQLSNDQAHMLDKDIKQFKFATAFDVLCSNSELEYAPKNIFHMVSERNPLLPCSHELRA